MEYSSSVYKASTKVIVAKTVTVVNHLETRPKSRPLWIARSILQLSSSKNEGGHIHHCQNSFAFTLLILTSQTYASELH